MASRLGKKYEDKLRKFQGIFEDACKDILDPKAITFRPIHITNCNGTGNWMFSEATIEYIKKPAFWAHLWYSTEYQAISEQLHGKNIFHTKAFECLLDCALTDKHLKCLRFLLSKNEKYNEAMVKSILAIHYFCPLVHNCSYIVDTGVTCKCSEKVRQGQTSFGIKGYWHGNADIVINESVVKVAKKPIVKDSCDDHDDGSEPEEVFVETLGSGEPSTSADVTSIIEVKLLRSMKKRAKSQAIAQAIVNAFYQAKVNPSLTNKYIPSFLATETYIRIILYKSGADILLLSEKFPIWETIEGESVLNVHTLMQVWLTLNCQKFDENILDFICERTPCSNFRKVVGEAVFSIYQNKVTRPLESKEYDHKKDRLALDLEGWNKATKCNSELFTSIMRYKKKRVSTEKPAEIPAKI